jgi:pSer/pThr/pTyr-binding forkhead associated (FHA) protein
VAGLLRPIGGPVGADLIRLPRARPFTIGRDAASNLQVYDQRVSRHHARIEYERGEYVITDLDSTNGIYVNRQRITRPTVLRHGDEIDIANTDEVRFTFETRSLSEAPVAAGGV